MKRKDPFDWLTRNCLEPIPVAVVRDGYAQFVAWIYRLVRDDKPTIWYCVEGKYYEDRTIRRICLY